MADEVMNAIHSRWTMVLVAHCHQYPTVDIQNSLNAIISQLELLLAYLVFVIKVEFVHGQQSLSEC